MTIIRIKRSDSAGNPGTLAAGELAYSSLADNSSGGNRLYIGVGLETGGNAANHVIIGGKYFTDMLSHAPGTVTTGSAIITDSTNSIDNLKVGIISIAGDGTNGRIFNNGGGTTKDLKLLAAAGGTVNLPPGQKFKIEDLAQDRMVFVGADGALADDSRLTFTTASGKLSSLGGVVAGNIDITGSTITNSLTNGDIHLRPSGSGKVRVGQWTLPTTTGTNKYVLTSDGADGSIWAQASTTLSYNVDGAGANVPLDLVNEVLFFTGSTGIRTSTSTVGKSVVFTLDRASTTDPGIAQFTATSFAVDAAGLVSIKTGGITNAQLVNKSITLGSTVLNLGDTTSSLVLSSITGGSVQLIGNSVTATIAGSDLNLFGNGSGKVSIAGLYTFPNVDGTAGQALITDGSGNVTFQSVSTNLRLSADSGGTGTQVSLLNDTFGVVGGEGISTAVSSSGTSKIITVSGADATTSVKGIAKFNTSSFSVSSGNVDLAPSVLKRITVDNSATITPLLNEIRLLGGIGITVGGINADITISSDYASYTVAGVAKFDQNTFLVNSSTGAVSIPNGAIKNSQLEKNRITLGDSDYILGTTSTVISGLSFLQVDRLRLSSNEIRAGNGVDTSSTVDINLIPQYGGAVNVTGARITNLGAPVDPFDAVNKAYVDALSVGLKIKESVRVATANSLTGVVIYNSGTNGVGAFLDLATPLTVLDSIPLVAGDRILVKDQVTTATNGIYVYTSSTRITRAADYDQTSEVKGGEFVFVTDGTAYGKTGWVQTELTTAIGTSTITFQQFSGAGTYVAGDGINLTGNRFDLDINSFNGGLEISGSSLQVKPGIAGNGLQWYSPTGEIRVVGTPDRISVTTSTVDIAANYAGQSSINTVGIITSGTWQGNKIDPLYGGTGRTSYTNNALLIGVSNSLGMGIGEIAIGGPGTVLQVNNSGTAVFYGDLDGGIYA